MVGYLSNDIPAGSDFAVRFSVYNRLRGLPFGVTVVLTVALCVCALTALVFLFCAAGHRRGREEICLNWQDRVPLDLYICLVIGLFSVAILPGVAGADSGMPAALTIATICLSSVVSTAVLLAVLLTLATRFKKGKWWRNTVCWRLVHWCKRLWKRCWSDGRGHDALAEDLILVRGLGPLAQQLAVGRGSLEHLRGESPW